VKKAESLTTPHEQEMVMNQAMVDATDKMDRYLFAGGLVITIVLSGMKIFGIIGWPWLWITAPVWAWVILTILRAQLIVRPWKKRTGQ
jgi:hypothetical protein